MADALLVERVGVLADRQIESPIKASELHVGLHLRPVLRLGRSDALGLELGKGLGAVRLELADVPGLRRLGKADSDRVHAAAEMPARVAQRPLPAGLGIDFEHGDADAPQVRDKARLRQMTGLEQPQDAACVPRPRGPTKAIPDGPRALGADQRGAEMRAIAGFRVRLIGGVDRSDGRARR